MVTLGVQIEPQFGYDYGTILQVGRACESLGFSTLTVSDHFMLRGDSIGMPSLECWSVLAALARDLSRVRIGPLVSCTSYRHPSLLAKMGATVDVLSDGRLEFGIGAGWKELEYKAYGYPFPSYRERVDRMSEAIDLTRHMWTEEKASFQGRYYVIQDALCDPKPVQRPGPPIWVGGGGDLVLQVAAQFADGVNVPFMHPERFGARLAKLEEFCEEEGRDPSEIRKSHFTWCLVARPKELDRIVVDFAKALQAPVENIRRIGQTGFIGTPTELVERLEGYGEAGANHIILGFAKGWEETSMELVRDEVMPHLTRTSK